MDQSLGEGGSLDPDLAQSPNQSITVSARGGQQAPNGNTSLSAPQLSQDLVILGSDLFESGRTLNWLAATGGGCRITLPPRRTY